MIQRLRNGVVPMQDSTRACGFNAETTIEFLCRVVHVGFFTRRDCGNRASSARTVAPNCCTATSGRITGVATRAKLFCSGALLIYRPLYHNEVAEGHRDFSLFLRGARERRSARAQEISLSLVKEKLNLETAGGSAQVIRRTRHGQGDPLAEMQSATWQAATMQNAKNIGRDGW